MERRATAVQALAVLATADLAIANTSDHSVPILVRKPDNSDFMQEGTPIAARSTPRAFAIADYNGDNKRDLAVLNQSQSVMILLQKSRFRPFSELSRKRR